MEDIEFLKTRLEYNKAILNSLLINRSVLFSETQPGAVVYDKEIVDGGLPYENTMLSYVEQVELIDHKLAVVRDFIKNDTITIENIEKVLDSTESLHARIYGLRKKKFTWDQIQNMLIREKYNKYSIKTLKNYMKEANNKFNEIMKEVE